MPTPRIDSEIEQRIRTAKQENPELSYRKLGSMFGVHDTTVMRVLARTPVEPEPEPESSEVNDPPFEDSLSGKWIYGKGYTYNGDSDTYVHILKCRPHPLVISGVKLRAMKRAYSNWSEQEATINQICRRFEIPRDQFIELKAIHGWTHDQEPFTKEEITEKDTEELVADAFQQKRQALWEGFEKKDWQETRKAAYNWNRLEQTFILPLREHVENFAPGYKVASVNIRASRSPFAVVANTGELHYGKAGWVDETGVEYNREIAEQRLLAARADMLQEVADRGRPEKFFWAFGNDQLHIDNEHNSTTKGTPQDCDGTAARILREGFEILVRDADSLLAVAPLEIVYVSGNHDHLLTYAMLNMLAAWYKDNKNVTVKISARSRSYATYGNTLLGFAHGDGALKPKDFMATMAKEAHEDWGKTRHRAFFTGHLHTEVVRELIGGTHYQMKSLSGADRYHERNAFLSEAGLNSYIIDKERGVKGTILWSAN